MGYVFYKGGKVNLGYVCIPSVIKLISAGCYKRTKNDCLIKLRFYLCIESVNFSLSVR